MNKPNYNLFFVTFCFLFSFIAHAQKPAFTVFFDINQIESQKNFNRIDSFLEKQNVKSLNINLIGYADFLFDEEYNKTLSLQRAKAIKNHLSKRTKQPFVNVIECTAKGETESKDNGKTTGDEQSRRVDIIIIASSKNENVNTQPVQILEPIVEEHKPNLVSNVPLQNVQVGQSIEIEGLSFIPGKHIIRESSIEILYNLLNTLKDNPTIKIDIQGHVCCIEDDKTDALDYGTGERNLSVSRAKEVFVFLVKNGIDKSRLSFKGFGHKHPKVFPESTPEEEQINRRVEIMVTAK